MFNVSINRDRYFLVAPHWLWKALDDHGKYAPCPCYRCSALRFVSPLIISVWTLINRIEVRHV